MLICCTSVERRTLEPMVPYTSVYTYTLYSVIYDTHQKSHYTYQIEYKYRESEPQQYEKLWNDYAGKNPSHEYKHNPAAQNTLHTLRLLSKCTEATISKAQLTTKEKKTFCTKV